MPPVQVNAFAEASVAHALLTLPDARAPIVVEPEAQPNNAANGGASGAAQEAVVTVAVQMHMLMLLQKRQLRALC